MILHPLEVGDAPSLTRAEGHRQQIPQRPCLADEAGRLLRDARHYEIGAGTSETRRTLIGRELIAETR